MYRYRCRPQPRTHILAENLQATDYSSRDVPSTHLLSLS